MIREYGSGLLFEPGNPEDLRRKVESLIENPRLLNTLVASCRPWPTVEEEVDRLHAVAREIVRDLYPEVNFLSPGNRIPKNEDSKANHNEP